ncbi:MAG TPA: GFA family protein [Gammaproteobacteria bacterium]|nr:GFA family protein [Gammaproteobacteria bacterium]
MGMRTASCSCGQLTATAVGDPIRVSICHCLACQRRTGSVFGAQARFPATSVTINGESREYVRTGDSGGRAHFHFCPTCGSTVYYTLAGSPETIAIPVGAFADPAFPTPGRSVYEERMHSWVVVPDDIEHLP